MNRIIFYLSAITLSFNTLAEVDLDLLTKYKVGILAQASGFPVKINERNIIRNGYIEGNTHILEIQVIDRASGDINDVEKGKIETQLRSTLGALYCKDGTNESLPRTLGLNIEYKYLDKDLEQFYSIVFSQENCNKAITTALPQRTEGDVRTEMQIRELNMAGTGTVTVCKEDLYNGSLTVFYSNESEKRAIVYAADEYVVNTVALSLNKAQIEVFGQQLLDAEVRANRSPNLENINLGKYQAQLGAVDFFGQKGNLKGLFKANTRVDTVILSLDARKINSCMAQITPFLD